jgi:hypothetical protein
MASKLGPQSRSYGIWGSFLHLPALQELRIRVHLSGAHSKRNDENWDTSTFCAKTVRNIIAALPHHIDLVGIGEPYVREEGASDEGGRYATAEEVQELFRQFESIREVDADVWRTEMECTLKPPASPRSGYDVQRARDKWAMV